MTDQARPDDWTGRRIVGNLHCDEEFAGGSRAMAAQAIRSASALATLLRVFAEPRDELWTPLPVEPERMAEVEGLSRPRLVSGPLDPLRPARQLLAWAGTGSVSSARAPAAASDCDAEEPLATQVWSLPRCGPSLVREVNHRLFCLETGERLGCALPGARVLASTEELRDQIAAGGAATGSEGRFVLKAPWSSAGRSRVILSPQEYQTPRKQKRVEKMFAESGSLLFEPWMERLADFGCVAIAGEEEVRVVGMHAQEVDPAQGRFQAIVLELGSRPPALLLPLERITLEQTALCVGERLRERGYRGSFGLDAWRYRVAGEQQVRFHPLGEINARLSMGLVAHALAERLFGPRHLGEPRCVRLRIGRLPPDPPSAAVRTIPLLLPGAENDTSAWLEIGPRAELPVS